MEVGVGVAHGGHGHSCRAGRLILRWQLCHVALSLHWLAHSLVPLLCTLILHSTAKFSDCVPHQELIVNHNVADGIMQR